MRFQYENSGPLATDRAQAKCAALYATPLSYVVSVWGIENLSAAFGVAANPDISRRRTMGQKSYQYLNRLPGVLSERASVRVVLFGLQHPFQTGVRFSVNALMPSAMSSDRSIRR